MGGFFVAIMSGICTIESCYSKGDISGTGAGGISGSVFTYFSLGNAKIINCYSLGNTIGTESGELLGVFLVNILICFLADHQQ